MSEIEILAVCFQLKQLKKQPEKKLGLNGTVAVCLLFSLYIMLTKRQKYLMNIL